MVRFKQFQLFCRHSFGCLSRVVDFVQSSIFCVFLFILSFLRESARLKIRLHFSDRRSQFDNHSFNSSRQQFPLCSQKFPSDEHCKTDLYVKENFIDEREDRGCTLHQGSCLGSFLTLNLPITRSIPFRAITPMV